ncbi:MAG: peptidase S15, partial [Hyphomicrobiales bacterium]
GLFGEGVQRFDEIDTTLSHSLKRELTITADDPLTARYRLTQDYEMGREGWRIRIAVRTGMRATADSFVLDGTLEAYENGTLAASRSWQETIPRDLV